MEPNCRPSRKRMCEGSRAVRCGVGGSSQTFIGLTKSVTKKY